MFNRFFRKLQSQPDTNPEQTVSFSSEVMAKRFSLDIEKYVDYVEMRVANRMVSIDVCMPALVIDAFKEEDVQELLYAIRAAVIAAAVGEEVEGEVNAQ